MSIKVKPGTARVPKGSDQDIIATLVNFDSQYSDHLCASARFKE